MQFSVFLANRVGQFKDMLDLFTEQDVNVLGVSIVDSTDWGVIRVVFDNPNKARELLKAHGLPFTESEVLLIELFGPDAISDICAHLLQAEINVHFAYPLTIRSHDNPVMVFHVEDYILARDLLTRHGLTLLGEEDLADPR